MKTALFEKPHSLAITTKRLRALGVREILIKTEACGVCGTDLHIVEGTSRSTPPVVLGHEYCGVVEELGKGVTEVRVGDLVAIDLLHSGKVRIDLFRIDTFPLEEIHDALAVVREGTTMKSMILPNSG